MNFPGSFRIERSNKFEFEYRNPAIARMFVYRSDVQTIANKYLIKMAINASKSRGY